MSRTPAKVTQADIELPLYVRREQTRHGRTVYYFRRDGGKRTRLPDPNATEFASAYHAAITGYIAHNNQVAPDSLAWLIQQYRASAVYADLSDATRRQRDNILGSVTSANGEHPYRAITASVIAASIAARQATPTTARRFLQTMRALFRWAVECGLVADDPTTDATNPKNDSDERQFPTGYVYILRSADLYKIGFATNVQARVNSLKTGSPFPLEIISWWPASQKEEQQLHKRYAEYRRHGEWFEIPGDVVKQLRQRGEL